MRYLLVLLISASLHLKVHAADAVYVYAHLPSGEVYDSLPSYTVNARLPVTVKRQSEGTYSVYFNRVFEHVGGWSVSKYGNEGGRCNLGFENTVMFQERLQTSMTVLCFDDANRQKDSKFTLLRMSGGRFGVNSLAYGLFYYDRDEDGAVRPLIGFQYPNASFGNTERNDAHLRYYSRGYYYAVLSPRAHTDELGRASIQGERYDGSFVLISSFFDHMCNGSGTFNAAAILCGDEDNNPAEGVGYYLAGIKDIGYHSSFTTRKDHDNRYIIDEINSYRSDGGVQSIAQLGLGEFKVTIGPEANVKGHVQLSSHRNELCSIKRWSGGDVFVTCSKNGVKTNPEGFKLVAIKWPNRPILREEFRGQLDPSVLESIRNGQGPVQRENLLGRP